MKIRSRLLTQILAWTLVTSLKLLFRTLKKEFVVLNNDWDLDAYNVNVKGRYLYCTWHDSILMPLFLGQSEHMAAIVSQHQDGTYLAEVMRHLRIMPVRGSSRRGAVKALREALTAAETHHITVTPDGPRGPRRQMKDGIIYIASKSGRPIVPMTTDCERCWKIKGDWSDLVVPKPFSHVKLILHPPIHVPDNLDRQQIEAYTQQIQDAMDYAYDAAEHRRAA